MNTSALGDRALWVLAGAGILCGVSCVAVFRRLTDREALRGALRRMTAHLLEMNLYLDDPVVVFRAQKDLFRANASLLRAVALPVLVLTPIVFLVAEALESAYSRAPLAPGDTAVVTLAWSGSHGGQRPTLRVPGCVEVETPGVRAVESAQVSWRIRALAPCSGKLEIVDGNRATDERIAVAGGMAPERSTNSLAARWLDPFNEPIRDPNIAWIETSYPRAAIDGWSWAWWFTLFYVAGAALFTGQLRARPMVACLLLSLALPLAPKAATAKTPVILISIDTLRADHLSAYGYKRIHTPQLDSFATGGTIFEDASCQIPLTLPSHASLFSSTYPFQNRIEENALRVPDGLVTLASVLRGFGYRTAAFVGSAMMGRQFGLDSGFELYDSPFQILPTGGQGMNSMRVRRDGALVVRAASEWLQSMRGKGVFAFIHLFDLHTPYPSGRTVPETDAYDKQLIYVDREIGQLRGALEREGWWNRSLVIVLADHGESLGDHGESSHGYFIYRSTVHVPLLIHWPAGTGPFVQRVAAPVGLIDVAPSILEALGIAAPKTFQGRSVLACARTGGPVGEPVYSETVYARDEFRWAPLRSLQEGGWRYIQAPKPELYDVAHDPGESNNVAAHHRAGVEHLRDELAKLMSAGRRAAVVPAGANGANRALLESLGYLSGGGGNSRAGNIDPKDRLAEYNRFEKGLDEMYAGRINDATAQFKMILTEDPENVPARGDLGECYQRAGRKADAAREWETALREDSRFAPAAEALGELWLERKDYRKAREAFEKLSELDGKSYVAEFGLGVADEHLGLKDEARKHLNAACRLAPTRGACEAELRGLGAAR